MSFSLSSTVKQYPRLPYKEIALAILGDDYDLSLVFVGPTRAQTLNQTYRQKDYIPNVLSFPVDHLLGEIFICPAVAKKEAPDYNLSYEGYVGFLLIHGCLHLKGYDHGNAMEKREAHYMKTFTLS